ncbi:MAG: hypothetical protein ACI4OU_06295 [Candidatus Enterenecus sp.]
MFKRTYRVLMRTPIGDRWGTMEVQIERNRATGRLNILKRTEPFDGSVDENGDCRLTGRLVTLTQTIPYTATGRILPDSLQLRLEGGRHMFPMMGVADSQE